MSARRRLAQLYALTPAQRRVLGEALLVLPAACATLKLAGMRGARQRLARWVRSTRQQQGIDAPTVARLVAIAARHGPFRARCLAASLTLESLLRRHGLDSRLRIGVRRHEGRIEAHAWVEHAGSVLDGIGAPGQYTPFEELASRTQ